MLQEKKKWEGQEESFPVNQFACKNAC